MVRQPSNAIILKLLANHLLVFHADFLSNLIQFLQKVLCIASHNLVYLVLSLVNSILRVVRVVKEGGNGSPRIWIVHEQRLFLREVDPRVVVKSIQHIADADADLIACIHVNDHIE